MRLKPRCLVAIGILFEASSAASADRPLGGDAGNETVSLTVEGHGDGCPSTEEFFRRMQARAPGIQLAEPRAASRVVVARFEVLKESGVAGRLRIQGLEGQALVREVSGRSCLEVAEALTFIAAVAIQSSAADLGDMPAVTPPAAPPPSAPPEMAPLPHAPSTQAPTRWRWSIHAGGLVRTQILPVPLYAAGAGAEVAHEGASLWQPAFGVAGATSFSASASTDEVVPGSDIAGQLTWGRLYASPLRLLAGPLQLRPYAMLEVGRLVVRGQGTGLAQEGQSEEIWFAVGLSARAEMILFGPFGVGAEVGAEIHPARYNFQFSPLDVYRVPTIGFAGAAAISFRFD